MDEDLDQPHGEPALRTVAMPADTNPAGDIFGGWVLAQMDVAGGVIAHQRAHGRVATVAIEAMTFHLPVKVGDLVSCYAHIVRVGRSSITMRVETWSEPTAGGRKVRVTEGTFVYVALDASGKPRPVPKEVEE
jgi:acyl-CoA thioesterase YciA